MNQKKILLVAVAGAIAISGCSLAPEYKVPDAPSPSAYKESDPWQLAVPADHVPRGNWWESFGDPELNKLEARIESGNFDLAAAVARYDFARAFAQELGSGLFPDVSVGANATRNRQSEGRPLRGANQPSVYEAYTLGGGASYELDVWGRVRNLVSAGEALADASAADLESVRLTLRGELANNYFQMRGLDAEIKLLSDTAESYRRQLDLTNYRHQEGIVSGLDVSRAQTQLEEVRAQIASARARRALYEHAVASLVGEPAANFSLPPVFVVISLPDIPIGVPSSLLQRRPDIAAAERRVAAANAQIGVARAAFFPSLVLGAAGGFQNTVSAGLLTAPNSFWSIGPLALLSLFDGGRRDAQVAEARAKTDETAALYRATVLRAFKEVEDNLAILREQRVERDSELAAVAAARHTFDLAMNRYREGVVNYLEVVDAETAKLRTERAALDINTRGLLASVNLIRALGGGWSGPILPPVVSDTVASAGADSHE